MEDTLRFVVFTQSLISDWNNGNAHFLRGVASELQQRGHELAIFEPENSWSRQNLVNEYGAAPLEEFSRYYPGLQTQLYDENTIHLQDTIREGDVVLVHEWNSAELIARIGALHSRRPAFTLLFHDTHHRSVSDAAAIDRFDLSGYDGVLAFGKVIRDLYIANGWAGDVWTWHEAADTRLFKPHPEIAKEVDVVWVGNWGDDERSEELREFLIEPVKRLGLSARVYGVRWPDQAVRELQHSGIDYMGWLPNYKVPDAFARARITIHVPRRPYTQTLPGIPTIRPFEAMACGIPLLSAPWADSEHLFRPGQDFLFAKDGVEMTAHLDRALRQEHLSRSLRDSGLETVRLRHTCSHRVDELLKITTLLRQRTLQGAA